MLASGEWAPWFSAAALNGNPRFRFDTVAGRPSLMLFAGSSRWPYSQQAIALAMLNRHRFDDHNASFFGVSIDPLDAEEGHIATHRPGFHWFLDYDRQISHKFGAMLTADGEEQYLPHWVVLDPMQRVVRSLPINCGEQALDLLDQICQRPHNLPAPVLMVPDVLNDALCQTLIRLHQNARAMDSGFMCDVAGRTELHVNHRQKCRTDAPIEDAAIIEQLRAAILRSIVPAIQRAFNNDIHHIERFIVANYDAETPGPNGVMTHGHFRPHRDNTTLATAHRRFACSINLNHGAYLGGELRLPEFGPQLYSAPTGGALIFSCGLLHEVMPVTQGSRYVFLPFLHDAAAEKIRRANSVHLAPPPDIRPAA